MPWFEAPGPAWNPIWMNGCAADGNVSTQISASLHGQSSTTSYGRKGCLSPPCTLRLHVVSELQVLLVPCPRRSARLCPCAWPKVLPGSVPNCWSKPHTAVMVQWFVTILVMLCHPSLVRRDPLSTNGTNGVGSGGGHAASTFKC